MLAYENHPLIQKSLRFSLTSGDYEKSKALETVPGIDHLPKSLKESLISSSSRFERQKLGQQVVDAICSKLGIPKVQLHVLDQAQKHRDNAMGSLKTKTLGQYAHMGDVGVGIRIWNLTAKRRQVVSGKTFFNTLLHEICHHIDCAKLDIVSSPHTSGFYKRISFLESSFV